MQAVKQFRQSILSKAVGQEQYREQTFSMASAVLTGTVDFSTTIFEVLETAAIILAAPSQYVRSAAFPAPTPLVFVGVLTLHRRHNLSQTTCHAILFSPNFIKDMGRRKRLVSGQYQQYWSRPLQWHWECLIISASVWKSIAGSKQICLMKQSAYGTFSEFNLRVLLFT